MVIKCHDGVRNDVVLPNENSGAVDGRSRGDRGNGWRAKQENAIVRFSKRLRQRKKLAGRAFGEPPLEIKRVRGWQIMRTGSCRAPEAADLPLNRACNFGRKPSLPLHAVKDIKRDARIDARQPREEFRQAASSGHKRLGNP